MNSKPLTYDSLKCVLEYVEANRRIEIARRCPSIRKVEKLVPLHLNELVFKDNGFKLNNMKYELGIHQKYHVGNIPDSVRQHNKLGGYTMDLNNFGLEDGRYLNVLTPGDILVKEKPWEENDLVIENRIRHVEELVRAFGDPVGIMPDEYERINELIFLKYLHENAPVPFENVFRLKISTFMGNETVEFYRYNMSYYQAVKKLSMLLFGERSKPIGAKNLYIYQSHIIRLPPNLKIKNIVQMQIPCEAKAVCEAIPEMFEEPNLLLEHDLVEGVLEMATQWTCAIARQNCIHFLNTSSALSYRKKFKLAQEFDLMDVKKRVIAECKTCDKLHNLVPYNVQDLDRETMALFFERNLALQGFPGRYVPGMQSPSSSSSSSSLSSSWDSDSSLPSSESSFSPASSTDD
ncbi:hypothetical protein CAEBREN_18665 [Caenorhabditis brenneri]|uniref:Uncharacterized protein n=1 Tax=Caenorhabditis brenneri TaxID=135651 RepID=G0NUC3_CAEBE|nr:hypothetical protein CAEBREN_18665 [Caenorhabditis brenneri]